MPTLNMVITDAGRAAIVAASGVDPVTITEVAIGDSGYTATASQTDLVNEIKRVTALTGVSSVDDYTMSFSFTDSSSDTYTMREFGLYSDAGILIAVYSETDPILTKSASSFMSLSAEIVLDALDAASVTFGDTNFSFPPASTTRAGIIEIADTPESQSGDSNSLALSPAGGRAQLARYGVGGVAHDADSVITGAKSFNDPLLYNTNGFFEVSGSWTDGPNGTSTYGGILQTLRKSADGLSAIVQNLWANGGHYIRTATLTGGAPTWGSWFVNYTSQDFTINQEIPAGIPLPWSQVVPPVGWFECNGAEFNPASYPELLIAYPNNYLPNLQGEFIRGWSNGRPGVDVDRALMSWAPDAIRAHSHAVYPHAGVVGGSTPGANGGDFGTMVNDSVTGMTGGVETVPRSIAMMYIVRAR